MVNAIFSDFDYTLLNYYSDKNYFDNYQVDILKKLRDSGVIFVIVSGRSLDFFKKFDNIFFCVDYIISSNGSYIYDVQNRKCIYYSYIESDDVINLREYALKYNYNLFYNSNGIQYHDSNFKKYGCCEQVVMFVGIDRLDSTLEYADSFSNTIYNNISRKSNRYAIDFNCNCVSKGNSIKYLCKYLGIDINKTIGFGDSDNDLSMFNVVGKAIAVSNATENIREHADDIILSVDDNGVFKYIKNIVLGGK